MTNSFHAPQKAAPHNTEQPNFFYDFLFRLFRQLFPVQLIDGHANTKQGPEDGRHRYNRVVKESCTQIADDGQRQCRAHSLLCAVCLAQRIQPEAIDQISHHHHQKCQQRDATFIDADLQIQIMRLVHDHLSGIIGIQLAQQIALWELRKESIRPLTNEQTVQEYRQTAGPDIAAGRAQLFLALKPDGRRFLVRDLVHAAVHKGEAIIIQP